MRWWCLAHPVWESGIPTVPGKDNDHPADGRGTSYTRQSGPSHAEKCWRIGPGGWLCHFDNVPQVGVSAGAENAGNFHSPTQHPMPNHTTVPMFAISYLASGRRRWSKLDNSIRKQPVTTQSWIEAGECCRTNKWRVKKWGQQKSCLLQNLLPCSNIDSGAISSEGCGVCKANLACVHRHMPRLQNPFLQKIVFSVIFGKRSNLIRKTFSLF